MVRASVCLAAALAVLAATGGGAGGAPTSALSVAVTAVEAAPFGATLRWRASTRASVVVEYGLGEELAVWSRRVVSGPSGAGRSALTALEPAREYRYRVLASARKERAVAEGSFATPAWPLWVGATTSPRGLLVSGQPFFPRMVWAQCPWAYPYSLGAGVNVFMATGCGSVDAQLQALAGRALSITSVDGRRDGPSVVGFHHLDEADVLLGRPDDLPLLPSSRVSRRPTFLTLSNHFYSGASPLPQGRAMYPALVERVEMVGFNLYPLQIWCRRGVLHATYEAQRELVALARGKPTYQWIEAGPMSQCAGLDPSPAIVRAETWLAVAGGARGIGWFPDFWSEPLRAEIARLSRELASLAPALLAEEGEAVVAPADGPVKAGVRRHNGATYVIAVNSWIERTKATIRVPGLTAGTLRVLGEKRVVQVRNGAFVDAFRGLKVRIYVAPPRGG
jgi:hypothetical protein